MAVLREKLIHVACPTKRQRPHGHGHGGTPLLPQRLTALSLHLTRPHFKEISTEPFFEDGRSARTLSGTILGFMGTACRGVE